MPLIDKKKQHKLGKTPVAPPTHTWAENHGGKIEFSTFARHKNSCPPSDGAKTHLELPAGVKRTPLRGNKDRLSAHDVFLHDNAPVKWRFMTHGPDKDAFVMVRMLSNIPRWGFVPRVHLPPQ
jgi:hypothetical protein